MSTNDDYTTGNLLDFLYHQNYYKLIRIGLSGQTNTSIFQEIKFTEKVEEDDAETLFFITGKQLKNILSFSLDSLIATEQYK